MRRFNLLMSTLHSVSDWLAPSQGISRIESTLRRRATGKEQGVDIAQSTVGIYNDRGE
jgi:hypothetical protein